MKQIKLFHSKQTLRAEASNKAVFFEKPASSLSKAFEGLPSGREIANFRVKSLRFPTFKSWHYFIRQKDLLWLGCVYCLAVPSNLPGGRQGL